MTLSADSLASLPKVELHVHLEGSIRAGTAIELAERHGEDPQAVLVLEDGRYPRRFRSFLHFVDTYLATSRQLRDPADLRTAAADFARAQAAQHVRYTEATFTAVTHVRNGMEPRAMWEAVSEGFASVAETEVRLIVDAVRNLGREHAEETVALVEDALADGAPIAGLGLAGIEGSAPETELTVLRSAADRLGLGLAVHAGETGSADDVRRALDVLGADRIGHGIAVVGDPALVERLVREGVPLEVCPSSNVSLGIVEDLEEHPFARMWHAGLAVTVNSDDPPFFSTTLTDELGHAARLAGLGRPDVAELQRRAARAAFLSPDRRDALLGEIDAWEQDGSQAG
ncbi:MAG: adenosine deaminase [Actinobacteria bacterium]|nr:adenosine deaminase [Actinomycetota bacterium]